MRILALADVRASDATDGRVCDRNADAEHRAEMGRLFSVADTAIAAGFDVLPAWVWPNPNGDGTLKKLINDPSLYNHLNEAACQVTKLLPKLEPILRDVNVFTDKIARHPESLGVRGAISPSSGLKESPTPLPVPGPAWNKP